MDYDLATLWHFAKMTVAWGQRAQLEFSACDAADSVANDPVEHGLEARPLGNWIGAAHRAALRLDAALDRGKPGSVRPLSSIRSKST